MGGAERSEACGCRSGRAGRGVVTNGVSRGSGSVVRGRGRRRLGPLFRLGMVLDGVLLAEPAAEVDELAPLGAEGVEVRESPGPLHGSVAGGAAIRRHGQFLGGRAPGGVAAARRHGPGALIEWGAGYRRQREGLL